MTTLLAYYKTNNRQLRGSKLASHSDKNHQMVERCDTIFKVPTSSEETRHLSSHVSYAPLQEWATLPSTFFRF